MRFLAFLCVLSIGLTVLAAEDRLVPDLGTRLVTAIVTQDAEAYAASWVPLERMKALAVDQIPADKLEAFLAYVRSRDDAIRASFPTIQALLEAAGIDRSSLLCTMATAQMVRERDGVTQANSVLLQIGSDHGPMTLRIDDAILVEGVWHCSDKPLSLEHAGAIHSLLPPSAQ